MAASGGHGSLHVPPSHWGDQERAVADRRNEIYSEEGGIVRNGCAIPEQRHGFDTLAD